MFIFISSRFLHFFPSLIHFSCISRRLKFCLHSAYRDVVCLFSDPVCFELSGPGSVHLSPPPAASLVLPRPKAGHQPCQTKSFDGVALHKDRASDLSSGSPARWGVVGEEGNGGGVGMGGGEEEGQSERWGTERGGGRRWE